MSPLPFTLDYCLVTFIPANLNFTNMKMQLRLNQI